MICDEDGKIIYAWTVDGTGEHEKTPSGDQEQDSRRPPLLDDVDDMPAIDEIWQARWLSEVPTSGSCYG